MGIKKDAFFRHMTRVAMQEWFDLYNREIHPVLYKAHGNVERALKMVMENPQQYPRMTKPAIDVETLRSLWELASTFSFKMPEKKRDINILKQIRKDQPARPRQDKTAAKNVTPEIFLRVLKDKEPALYRTLNRKDIQDISDIIENPPATMAMPNTPDQAGRQEKEEDQSYLKRVLQGIKDIIQLAKVRSFLEHADDIVARLSKMTPKSQILREASHQTAVSRIVMAYLDRLDTGA